MTTALSTDALRLYEAVLRDPADDAVRLVLADELEETEPERAAFIRVQCELAAAYTPNGHVRDCYVWGCADQEGEKAHPCKLCGPLYALRRRERELLDAHASKFIAGLPGAGEGDTLVHGSTIRCGVGPLDSHVFEYTFFRGMVEIVECGAKGWLAHADALVWCWGQCPACPGNGVRYAADLVTGSPRMVGMCETCAGSGRVPPTMSCPECGHTAIAGEVLGFDQPTKQRPKGSWSPRVCPTCKGDRRVPRPCRGTEHPIKRVRLTTMPRGHLDHRQWKYNRDKDEYKWNRYPDIIFKLPTGGSNIIETDDDLDSTALAPSALGVERPGPDPST